LHQNSHPTRRQQVRSWNDLLTSRGRRRARGDGFANPAAPSNRIEDVTGARSGGHCRNAQFCFGVAFSDDNAKRL
jgi:hypothetical protein